MTTEEIRHTDLPLLRSIRGRLIPEMDYERAFLDRLIAAADADAPPLPEGWVLLHGDDGGQYPYWHEDNRLRNGRGPAAYKIEATAASMRDRLTPLRPAVTEADLVVIYNALVAAWSGRPLTVKAVEQALTAAGIEVTP